MSSLSKLGRDRGGQLEGKRKGSLTWGGKRKKKDLSGDRFKKKCMPRKGKGQHVVQRSPNDLRKGNAPSCRGLGAKKVAVNAIS